MNKRQKLVQQQFLNSEGQVIGRLKSVYGKASDDIAEKIKNLSFTIGKLQEEYDWLDPDDPERAKIKSKIQSKIYQRQYQEQLQRQVDGVFGKIQTQAYTTVSSYLDECYEDGFIGSLFDAHGQGVPITTPINQEAMVRAVQLDSKISKGLYTRLGEDVGLLKKKITAEVSRSIATGRTYEQTARALSGYTKIGFNNAVRIARTEGHRIQCQSAMDAMTDAKERGADVLKQWDATLDSSTRESHAKVDMEIRELDKPFSNGLMFPGDPRGGAAEVINCRCSLDQRARWEFEDDDQSFTKFNSFTGEIQEFESPETYDEFKKAFFSKENRAYMKHIQEMEEQYGTKDFRTILDQMSDQEYNRLRILENKNPLFNKYAPQTTNVVDVAPVSEVPRKVVVNNDAKIQQLVSVYGDEATLKSWGYDKDKATYQALLDGVDIDAENEKAYAEFQKLASGDLTVHSKKLGGLTHEEAIIFDADGNVVLYKRGDVAKVDFTPEEQKLFKGKNLTHNHPYEQYGTTILSGQDILFADKVGLDSVTTINTKGTIRTLYRDKYFVPEDVEHLATNLSTEYRRIWVREGPEAAEKFLIEKAHTYGWRYSITPDPSDSKALEIFKKYVKSPLTNSSSGGIIQADNSTVRKWYLDKVSKIYDGIDPTLPLEKRARLAFDKRNAIRDEARNMMADHATRRMLDKDHPNPSFEDFVKDKMKRKGMTREQAMEDIYKTAIKTNKNVNKELGIEGDD